MHLKILTKKEKEKNDNKYDQTQAKSQKSLCLLVVMRYPPTFLLFLLTAIATQLAFCTQYSATPTARFPAHVTISRHVTDRFFCPTTRSATSCLLAASTIAGPFSFPSTITTSTHTYLI